MASQSEEDASKLAEKAMQLTLGEGKEKPHPQPPEAPPTDRTPLDSGSYSDHENDDDLLGQSMGDEVGQLLRATVEELETALEESRRLLAERDGELLSLRSELERYKQQAAREIANKTRLAQALDESHSHASQLEELLQQWQMEITEGKVQEERLRAHFAQEQSRAVQLERRLADTQEAKDKEIEQLKSQLIEARQNLSRGPRSNDVASESNPGPSGIDEMQLHFLKQAVYHLLTDFHADDQLRAIVSILDFGAQERKSVYAKLQERKRRPSRTSGVL